jgi:ribosome-associated toxin RatA of RatAB toxin-antitoxin module
VTDEIDGFFRLARRDDAQGSLLQEGATPPDGKRRDFMSRYGGRLVLRLALLFLALWTPVMHAEEFFPHPMVQANAHRIQQNGEAVFEVNASSFVRATPQHAWRVLTDYDRLAEFVPDLVSSKVVSRTQHEAIVEQRSQAGFLFVSQSIRMVVRITEQPFSKIDVAQVSGDMRHYAAHWELAPFAKDGVDGTRITFSGTMEPDFFVPPLLGTPIVQGNVRKMVEAVASEIERRSAH